MPGNSDTTSPRLGVRVAGRAGPARPDERHPADVVDPGRVRRADAGRSAGGSGARRGLGRRREGRRRRPGPARSRVARRRRRRRVGWRCRDGSAMRRRPTGRGDAGRRRGRRAEDDPDARQAEPDGARDAARTRSAATARTRLRAGRAGRRPTAAVEAGRRMPARRAARRPRSAGGRSAGRIRAAGRRLVAGTSSAAPRSRRASPSASSDIARRPAASATTASPSIAEPRPQPAERSRQPGLHGAARHAEQLGGLGLAPGRGSSGPR